MSSIRIISLFAAFLLLFQTACKDEPEHPNFDASKLVGRWELETGWRNNRETQTLTGTYYEFTDDGKMRTNLTPSTLEIEFPYSFSGNEIKQKSEPPAIYQIDSLTDTVLIFGMKINDIPFRLAMKKFAATPEDGTDNNTPSGDSL